MDSGYVRERTFRFILDELQSARLASEVDAKRHQQAIQRFRVMAEPIVESAADAMPHRGNRFDDLADVRSAYKCDAVTEGDPEAQRMHISRMTLAELKRELDDTPDVEKLATLRRRFAMERHPDRVGHIDRQQATTEMQIANDLIDQAIQGYHSPQQ